MSFPRGLSSKKARGTGRNINPCNYNFHDNNNYKTKKKETFSDNFVIRGSLYVVHSLFDCGYKFKSGYNFYLIELKTMFFENFKKSDESFWNYLGNLGSLKKMETGIKQETKLKSENWEEIRLKPMPEVLKEGSDEEEIKELEAYRISCLTLIEENEENEPPVVDGDFIWSDYDEKDFIGDFEIMS